MKIPLYKHFVFWPLKETFLKNASQTMSNVVKKLFYFYVSAMAIPIFIWWLLIINFTDHIMSSYIWSLIEDVTFNKTLQFIIFFSVKVFFFFFPILFNLYFCLKVIKLYNLKKNLRYDNHNFSKIIKEYYAYEPDSKLIKFLIQLKWIMGFLGIIPQFGKVYIKRDLLNKLSKFKITNKNFDYGDIDIDRQTNFNWLDDNQNFNDNLINRFLELKFVYLGFTFLAGGVQVFWHINNWGFLANILTQGIYNNDWRWEGLFTWYYGEWESQLYLLKSSIILIMYFVTILPPLIYIFILNKNIKILLKSQNKNKIILNGIFTTSTITKLKSILIVCAFILIIFSFPIPIVIRSSLSHVELNKLKLNLS